MYPKYRINQRIPIFNYSYTNNVLCIVLMPVIYLIVINIKNYLYLYIYTYIYLSTCIEANM